MITRLLTFGLNLATARSLTPEAYGVRGSGGWSALREPGTSKEQCCPVPVPALAPLPSPAATPRHATRAPCASPSCLHQVAAVQFHLINTTILFIAREGFRRACLRIDQSAAGASRRAAPPKMPSRQPHTWLSMPSASVGGSQW